MTTTHDTQDDFRVFGDAFGGALEALFGPPKQRPVKPFAEQLRDTAADINEVLMTASRRVLLMHGQEAATRHFEDLAAEADTLRRIIARMEKLTTSGRQRADAEAALFDEADACVTRTNRLVEQGTTSRDLVVAARRQRDAILQMTPQQFEHQTAQMFMLLERYSIEQWGGGCGDIGADVIARMPGVDGQRVIIQCKHTGNLKTRIGSSMVQQVSGVRQAHGADLALVVTTGEFTAPARAVAKKLGVGLVEGIAYWSWTVMGYPLADFNPFTEPTTAP